MTSRAEALLDITTRLFALVSEEIRLIEKGEARKLDTLEEERARLALLYTREIKAVKEDPTFIRLSPAALQGKLKAETAAFNEALERHQKLIARMRRITEGIVKTIATEAARQKAPKTVYGQQGSKTQSAAAPIVINQKI